MFVKVKTIGRNDTCRRYGDCIVEKIDHEGHPYGVDAKTGDLFRLTTFFGEPLFEEVELPEGFDIKDQICYTDATEHIPQGTMWVKDEGDTVYKVLDWPSQSPMLKLRDTTEYDTTVQLRWDHLTPLDPNDEDNVATYDILSDEPIFTENSESALELYTFDRNGNKDFYGLIMPMNVEIYEDDIQRCDDCDTLFYTRGDYYFNSMYISNDGYRHICPRCYNRNGWGICDDCGDLVDSDYLTEGDDDGWYCESCIENHRRGRLMHDYGYKPAPIFHSINPVRPDTIFYGVELGIDNGRDVDECLEDLDQYSDGQDLFYCKHDGSLNDGIEIVSHPCTVDYHLEEFPWADITRVAKENAFKSHDARTCGLHIHASRSGLGSTRDMQDLTIAKVIILVDKFWDELVNFSRRNYSQLDRWAKKPNARIYSDDDEATVKEKAKDSCEYDRYKAVNLSNQNTVEFRLFRGSLQVETIKATIQFLDNVINFCLNSSLEKVQEAKWSDLINYASYDELNAYLEKRNLLNVEDRVVEEPPHVTRRFDVDDPVWFATENTGYEIIRGIVQSVNYDRSVSPDPLYVVISGEGENERVNFLVDSEIVDTDDLNELERAYQNR